MRKNHEDAEIDKRIRKSLWRQAESIQTGSSDMEIMKRAVYRRIEEGSGMKKWNIKRTFVTAVAICAAGSITAVAAGKIVSVSGSSSHKDEFSYSQLADMEDKLGYPTNVPEGFSNGYTFDTGVPVHQEASDETGNIVKSAESLDFTYKKEGQPEIYISVENIGLFEEEGPYDEKFDHSGISLRYSRDQYMFVPPDYEPSDEEKAKEAAGELYISYGSSQVEHSSVQSMIWEEEERVYILTTMDNPITAEELAHMAGEVIDR